MAKSKQRDFALAIFNDLYSFEDLGNRHVCAYCGDVRESLDHIPPISLALKIGTKELRRRGVSFVKVPCCKACNNRLSDRKLGNYEERLNFLYTDLIRRFESKSYWTKEEIEENLRGELKRVISARSDYLMREYVSRLRGMEFNMCRLVKKEIPEVLL